VRIDQNFAKCYVTAAGDLLSDAQELSRKGPLTGQGHRKCWIRRRSRVGGTHGPSVLVTLVSRLTNHQRQIAVAVIACIATIKQRFIWMLLDNILNVLMWMSTQYVYATHTWMCIKYIYMVMNLFKCLAFQGLF